MITIPGQLAIKTIHGRNGDFNVGRLATSIGEFVVKNAELDQYAEGKYEGDFAIAEIRPSTYTANGRMVIEIRALLGGMTLSNIDALSRDDARRLSPQEVDPIDEEAQTAAPTPTTAPRRPAGRRCAAHATRWSIPRRSAANRRLRLPRLRPMQTMAATRRCSARSGRWAMSSSSMPPWIGVCCVSSATASVISATSSHRCPRTGTSPGSDSHRRLARHSTTHRGSSPVGRNSGLFSQGDRHATCIPLRSSLPGVALKSPAVG